MNIAAFELVVSTLKKKRKVRRSITELRGKVMLRVFPACTVPALCVLSCTQLREYPSILDSKNIRSSGNDILFGFVLCVYIL